MTDRVALGCGARVSATVTELPGRPTAGPRDAAAGLVCAPASEPARMLRLVLACLWLLDAILQVQSFMFGRGFAAMLRAAAAGNPVVVAAPIGWGARFVLEHATVANAAFAAIQLLIALGIACRPTLRIALAASIAWSVAVWWLGEGFGGLLTGQASPVNGAPGAVILYALLAVLLWPSTTRRPAAFAAGLAVGARAARLAWLVVWGSLAACALLPASRGPRAIAATIDGAAAGQPAWLGHVDGRLAAVVSRNGLAAAVVLAVVLALVAIGVCLPRPAVPYVLALAMLTAAVLWLAQGLGGLLTGAGTDPGTAPLLALLALAYWPRDFRRRRHFKERIDTAGDVKSFAIMAEGRS